MRLFCPLEAMFSAVLIALLFISGSVQAGTVSVTIDTTAIAGQSGALSLAFDFIGSNPASNLATITGFSTDGTLGAVLEFGGPVTGALPGDVSIGDTDFFNELLVEFTFGTSISFLVELSENFTAGFFPDSFSFFLLDASFQPLFSTSDPTGAGALFLIDIDGSPSNQLTTFTATGLAPGATSAVTWQATPVTASVPEPSGLLLLSSGLFCMATSRVWLKMK